MQLQTGCISGGARDVPYRLRLTRALLQCRGLEKTRACGCAFVCECGSPSSSPGSGKTSPERSPESIFPTVLEVEFTGCGENEPPSGKKRQATGECLQACICKELVRCSSGRTSLLLRGPRFQSQSPASPLPLASLAETFLASSGTAHDGAGCRSVSDMIGRLPGVSPLLPFHSFWARAYLERRCTPDIPKLPRARTMGTLS